MIEKQEILNSSRNENKDYAAIILNDFEVVFLKEEEDKTIFPSLYCVLVIYVEIR